MTPSDFSEAAMAKRVARRELKATAETIWEKHLSHVADVSDPQSEQLLAASMILLARAVLADA